MDLKLGNLFLGVVARAADCAGGAPIKPYGSFYKFLSAVFTVAMVVSSCIPAKATASPTEQGQGVPSTSEALINAGLVYHSDCYSGADTAKIAIVVPEVSCSIPVAAINPNRYTISPDSLTTTVSPVYSIPGTSIPGWEVSISPAYDLAEDQNSQAISVYVIQGQTGTPNGFATPVNAQLPKPALQRNQMTLEACIAAAGKGEAKVVSLIFIEGDTLSDLVDLLADCYMQSGPDNRPLYDTAEEALLDHLTLQNSMVVMREEDETKSNYEQSLGVDFIQPGRASIVFVKPDAHIIDGRYRPELTAADAVLPVGTEVISPVYKLCYIWTETHFHAGDGWYYTFNRMKAPSYTVYNPVSGTIVGARDYGGKTRWVIEIKTDFSKEGKVVYVDVVHTNGLVDGLRVESHVEKGQPLAKITALIDNGRLEALADIAFRNGPSGAGPEYDNWSPRSYFNPYPYFADDLALRPEFSYETCPGNPIPREKRGIFTPPAQQ